MVNWLGLSSVLMYNDFVMTSNMALLVDLKGHDNEKERLVMEMEAVVQEQGSLENQLASLRTQISNLASEVEEQRSTVSIDIYFD